jgi:hypothetical protein
MQDGLVRVCAGLTCDEACALRSQIGNQLGNFIGLPSATYRCRREELCGITKGEKKNSAVSKVGDVLCGSYTNPVASSTWAGERLQEVIELIDCPIGLY